MARKDLMFLRHLGMIVPGRKAAKGRAKVFQFFPDLPLIDFCIFNASGWDRIKVRDPVSDWIQPPSESE